MNNNLGQNNYGRQIAMVAIMAALANVLGLLALPGPLNIQFGLTGIPIYMTAFVFGPGWGALCGLLGGVTQASKYGSMLYIIYTALQGAVAGYFALRPQATRRTAPFFALFGGFFLLWWVDLLRNSSFTLKHLGETSFTEAPTVFGMNWSFPFPIVGMTGAVLFLGIVAIMVLRGSFNDRSVRHLTLAGAFGAIAYVPYDAWVLYFMQGYPWIPTWFVLSKDLVQDFVAAAVCAIIFQHPRIKNLLPKRS